MDGQLDQLPCLKTVCMLTTVTLIFVLEYIVSLSCKIMSEESEGEGKRRILHCSSPRHKRSNTRFLHMNIFYKKMSLKNPQNLKKILRKSPVSNS